MAQAEPAALDIHGATWTGKQDYKLDPTAKRYEVYEMSMAAKVSWPVHIYDAQAQASSCMCRFDAGIVMHAR